MDHRIDRTRLRRCVACGALFRHRRPYEHLCPTHRHQAARRYLGDVLAFQTHQARRTRQNAH